VSNLLTEGRSDVLSLGVALTLWSASRSANVLLRTVVIAYDLEDHRPAWKRRGVALVVTAVGLVMAILLIPLLAIGPGITADILDAVRRDASLAAAWPFLYWGGVVVAIAVGLTWLFHIAPGWHTPWHRDLPGAILAVSIWLASGFGIRVYTSTIGGFAQGDAFAGLAAPLVLLLWVYVTAMGLLLGAEFNAEIEKMRPTIDPSDIESEEI
jgi:membrane protein